MPTPIPQVYIDNFVAIATAVDKIAGLRVSQTLVNYEDITTAIGRYLSYIEQNETLMTEFINCFPDQRYLNAVGIFVNQAYASMQTASYAGPNLYVACTFSAGLTVASGAISVWLANGTTITGGLLVPANISLPYLYLSSGSSLDFMDSSQSGAVVGIITLNNAKTNPAIIRAIATGSTYNVLNATNGAVFGGQSANNPTSACAQPATGLQLNGPITHNTVPLSWTNPASGIIGVNIYYKKTLSPTWIQAQDSDGDYVGNSGFVFRSLSPDTSYDFQVTTTCKNGGISAPVVLAGQITSSSPA